MYDKKVDAVCIDLLIMRRIYVWLALISVVASALFVWMLGDNIGWFTVLIVGTAIFISAGLLRPLWWLLLVSIWIARS